MRIRQGNATEADGSAEEVIAPRLIHIVALDAFKHHADTTAYDCRTFARKVISKADSRTPVVPVVVHQPVGHSRGLSRNTKAVGVLQQSAELRIRTCRQAWTCSGARGIGKTRAGTNQSSIAVGKSWSTRRIVEIRIEVRHLSVDLGSVRHAIPAQAEIQCQALRCAPVVLQIPKPGDTVPVAVVFQRGLAVSARKTQQIVGKVIAGEIAVEGKRSFRRHLQRLQFSEVEPTSAKLELMSALCP